MEQPNAPDKQGDIRQRSDESPRPRDYDYFSDIGLALRNDPRAAYAFAALMYRISELTKNNQEVHAHIAPLAESGIRLGYEYTVDHEACLIKFKHTLAEEQDEIPIVLYGKAGQMPGLSFTRRYQSVFALADLSGLCRFTQSGIDISAQVQMNEVLDPIYHQRNIPDYSDEMGFDMRLCW